MVLSGGQRLTVLIGIPPPRRRPGRILGPNLDYAQVSLSLHMGHRHKMFPTFIDCTGIYRSYLSSINTMYDWILQLQSGVVADRWSWRTCNPAFLLRPYGERAG